MACHCQDVTVKELEKTILHLPKVKTQHKENPESTSQATLYNESTCLIEAVERFKERTNQYPECVLADQIYRTRANRNYCKEHGIRLSGSMLGRPSANVKVDKKQEYQDNTDKSKWNEALV